MPRALNLLRPALHYRRECFSAGMEACGLKVVDRLDDPRQHDVLLIWNRYGGYHEQANRFEKAGALVLVAENCPLGNDWRPGSWYSLALWHVAMTGGKFPAGDFERWDAIGGTLEPWRLDGTETVILGQRGIGAPGILCTPEWANSVRARFGGRIRAHPGTSTSGPTLREDLARAKEVITWSSGAAVQALQMGVPVWYRHEDFICSPACEPLSKFGLVPPARNDVMRLVAFRRLAWCIWELEEIRSGEPIRRLLEYARG